MTLLERVLNGENIRQLLEEGTSFKNVYCVFEDTEVPLDEVMWKLFGAVPQREDIIRRKLEVKDSSFTIVCNVKDAKENVEIRYTFKIENTIKPYDATIKDADRYVIITPVPNSLGFHKYSNFMGYSSDEEIYKEYFEYIRDEIGYNIDDNIAACKQ